MKAAGSIAVLMSLGIAAPQSLEKTIGGKGTDKYHESVFDPKTKLYLFSGGD